MTIIKFELDQIHGGTGANDLLAKMAEAHLKLDLLPMLCHQLCEDTENLHNFTIFHVVIFLEKFIHLLK